MRGGTKCPQQSPTHPQAHPEASANPLLRTAETLPSAGTWEGPQRQRGLLGSAESPPGHTAETRGGWNVEAGQAAGRQPCIPLRWRLCGGQARPKQGQPRDREMALGEWGETQGLGPRSLRPHSTQRMLHTHGVGHTHVGVLCRVTGDWAGYTEQVFLPHALAWTSRGYAHFNIRAGPGPHFSHQVLLTQRFHVAWQE